MIDYKARLLGGINLIDQNIECVDVVFNIAFHLRLNRLGSWPYGNLQLLEAPAVAEL